MEKKWDKFESNREFQLWTTKWGKEALRVLKPGGYAFVFGGSRVYHRMFCGIEDAGFKLKDCFFYLYVSGFPKSQDIAKMFDKYYGHEIKLNKNKLIVSPDGKVYKESSELGKDKWQDVYKVADRKFLSDESQWYAYEPTSENAKKWNGYKTAIKPAYEPIGLFQKKKDGTYIENILKWDVGALNIDGCRIPINVDIEPDNRIRETDRNIIRTTTDGTSMFFGEDRKYLNQLYELKGRYPSNIIIDEMMAEIMDAISGNKKSVRSLRKKEASKSGSIYGFADMTSKYDNVGGYDDSGGLSKYFQKVKISKYGKDRNIYGEYKNEREEGSPNYNDDGGLSKYFQKIKFHADVNRQELGSDTVFNKDNCGYQPPKEGISNYNDGEGLSKYFHKVPFRYVPKASKGERNLGLEDITPKPRDTSRTKPIDNPQNRNNPVKNFHGTVKPIKLLCYLIRMIRPPTDRPVILDPFLGSGSTAIACKIEQCDYIGIEMNPEYMEITKKRLAVPIKNFQKYTDTEIKHADEENQARLTDFKGWL